MCFLFHRWTKWSELKKELWLRKYIDSKQEMEYSLHYQDRTCKRCGKYQKRYIELPCN